MLNQASKYLSSKSGNVSPEPRGHLEWKGLKRLSRIYKGACPLCLHSSTQGTLLAFSHFRNTHFTSTHRPLHRSSRISVSSRPLDSILVVYIRGSLKMAPIAVGDTIPDGVLSYLDEDNTSQKFHVHEELKGKKVVLLAVPGAFTPTCRYLSLSVSISLWRSFWRASLGGKCLVGLSCRGVGI